MQRASCYTQGQWPKHSLLLYHSVNWTFIYFQTGVSDLLSCPKHVCVCVPCVMLCHHAAYIFGCHLMRSPSAVIPSSVFLLLHFHLSIKAEMFPMLTTAIEKCNSRRFLFLWLCLPFPSNTPLHCPLSYSPELPKLEL